MDSEFLLSQPLLAAFCADEFAESLSKCPFHPSPLNRRFSAYESALFGSRLKVISAMNGRRDVAAVGIEVQCHALTG
jgi:hypothetical protein